jgi:hypothetical protein
MQATMDMLRQMIGTVSQDLVSASKKISEVLRLVSEISDSGECMQNIFLGVQNLQQKFKGQIENMHHIRPSLTC